MSDDSGFERGRNLLRLNVSSAGRPSEFSLFDREWILLEDVFAPPYSASTETFASWLEYPQGGNFLEVGCGSGVISVLAALGGAAQVTALDISPGAVRNTAANARRHGVADRVHVLHSDMFTALNPRAEFDMIFWNSNFIDPPVGYTEDSDVYRALFDPGYQAHKAFLDSAAQHLAPGGRLLLGFSSLGNVELLDKMATDAGLIVTMLNSKPHHALKDMDYQLLELVPENSIAA
ncbi:methyltransferase [Streptomyces sp. NBC_00893]|uniref:methyltransferase n=1 Tax=Streptomyces sp. NBC_00893 TaxID=2975862 RepID=UPI00225A444B|nr:methyltransferase [Streptomyces sp. NBC_00893]MCX4851541.1 methyltransferase [Streptomyces sp. NBC_00893]